MYSDKSDVTVFVCLFVCILIHAIPNKISLSCLCRLERTRGSSIIQEDEKMTLVVVCEGENTTLISVEVLSILRLVGPRPQWCACILLTLVHHQSGSVEDPM